MKVTLVKERKQKPDFSKLGFGKYFTDHMLVMEYDEAKGGWDEPEIIPFDDFKISPACCSLHYGQGIFEGLKAPVLWESKVARGSEAGTIQNMMIDYLTNVKGGKIEGLSHNRWEIIGLD